MLTLEPANKENPMDEEPNNLWVHVTDSALMHLLMAGMESFKVHRRGKHVVTNRGPVETTGFLWGYVPEASNGYDHVVIQHATTDFVARRTKGWTELIQDSALAQQSVLSARWPHLALVGDFHTHPYESYSDVEANPGASSGDRAWYEEGFRDNVTKPGLKAGFRTSLVLSIAELKRVQDNTRFYPELSKRGNTLKWQMGRFRYWLTAYSVDRASDDDDSPLVLSPRERDWPEAEHAGRDEVYLDVPTIYGTDRYFEAGDLR